MFPVAPFIVRTATADTAISTCIIPKNSIIMMSIFNMQRVIITVSNPMKIDLNVRNSTFSSEKRRLGRRC